MPGSSGWPPSTRSKAPLEIKVGVVHTGSDPTGRNRQELVGRRYVATRERDGSGSETPTAP